MTQLFGSESHSIIYVIRFCNRDRCQILDNNVMTYIKMLVMSSDTKQMFGFDIGFLLFPSDQILLLKWSIMNSIWILCLAC